MNINETKQQPEARDSSEAMTWFADLKKIGYNTDPPTFAIICDRCKQTVLDNPLYADHHWRLHHFLGECCKPKAAKPEARDSSETGFHCSRCGGMFKVGDILSRHGDGKLKHKVCPEAAEPSPTASEPETMSKCSRCGQVFTSVIEQNVHSRQLPTSTADEAKETDETRSGYYKNGEYYAADLPTGSRRTITDAEATYWRDLTREADARNQAATADEAKGLKRCQLCDGEHYVDGWCWKAEPPTATTEHEAKPELQTCEQCKKQYLKQRLECPFCGHGWDEPVNMTIHNVKDQLLTKISDAITDDCLEKAERYTALFDRLVMSEVQSRMTDAHINGELMSEELE